MACLSSIGSLRKSFDISQNVMYFKLFRLIIDVNFVIRFPFFIGLVDLYVYLFIEYTMSSSVLGLIFISMCFFSDNRNSLTYTRVRPNLPRPNPEICSYISSAVRYFRFANMSIILKSNSSRSESNTGISLIECRKRNLNLMSQKNRVCRGQIFSIFLMYLGNLVFNRMLR